MPGTLSRLPPESDRDLVEERSLSSLVSSSLPLRDASLSTPTSPRDSPGDSGKTAHKKEEVKDFGVRLQSKCLNPKTNGSISWWWWWEILAIILSITCMFSLVVVLAKIDNSPLQGWWLPIQPNTLVAALITIGKASMMLAVASCIGQLKWRHFMIDSRRLSDLQLFEDARQGPWGSAMLLWSLCFRRTRVLVTFGFALITIVALAMDTSAQQVLAFPLRESRLTNASIELGVANMYTSKALAPRIILSDSSFLNSTLIENSNLLAFEGSIINGVTGSIYEPYFTCPQPASRCQWNTFTTLGICENLTDVTDIAISECVHIDSTDGMNCSYSFPGMADFEPSDITMTWKTENGMLFQSLFLPTVDGTTHILGSFVAINATTDGHPTYNSITREFDPPPVNVYSGTFTWCARTYRNIIGSQNNITEDLVSTEDLTFNRVGSYKEEIIGSYYGSYVANSTGLGYNISAGVAIFIPAYIKLLLSFTVKHNTGVVGTSPDNSLLDMAFTLQHSDLKKVFTGIADTLTNQIRSNKGDNYDASTIKGEAFFNETYIHVRWGWMSLPLAEVVLTAFLLVVSIVITRKQPLLKESIIALLLSRLEGWSEDELSVSGPQTREDLDELAEKMIAKLETDDPGRLRFQRGLS
ncbi:hypothetical protein F4781DRAFT_139361 [Annulohypoxylon bovei var. microspora]|nr:hypothetical protein F4781DRAFT_139361 [Annulohypoxylon bovei var. microspora]